MSLEESEDRFDFLMKNWNGGIRTIIYPPDAPKWRGEALKLFMGSGRNPAVSIAARVKTLAFSFDLPKKRRRGYFSSSDEEEEDEDFLETKKGWLDELEAYDGESIDLAALLHSRGRLFPFLRDALANRYACIRAKAAELITSMVQNHPTSQQLIIQEGNGIQFLLHNFTTDVDATSRTKALGAISSLIRNNKSGYEALRNALRSSTYREVVNLIEYLRPGTLKSLRPGTLKSPAL